jgi:hypothetical protein
MSDTASAEMAICDLNCFVISRYWSFPKMSPGAEAALSKKPLPLSVAAVPPDMMRFWLSAIGAGSLVFRTPVPTPADDFACSGLRPVFPLPY